MFIVNRKIEKKDWERCNWNLAGGIVLEGNMEVTKMVSRMTFSTIDLVTGGGDLTWTSD